MGAPVGNQNARKGKWSEALAKAVETEDPILRRRKLDAIADRLLEKALEGDIAAIKEMGDRLDGKAPQAMTLANEEGQVFTVRWKDDGGT